MRGGKVRDCLTGVAQAHRFRDDDAMPMKLGAPVRGRPTKNSAPPDGTAGEV
jgi:hypothetical protein